MRKTYLLLFCLFLFTACRLQPHTYSDISGKVEAVLLRPPDNSNYFYPVWMTDGKIIFMAFPEGENYFTSIPPIEEPDLRFYDTTNDYWGKVFVKLEPDCDRTTFYFLQRLPNERLGFVNGCLSYKTGVEVRTIREINISTSETKLLRTPLIGIRELGVFTFSTDMSELIQEDMANHILSNKLFYQKGDAVIQIAPNFIRAMHPGWSSYQRQIAFWGTETYPGKDPKEFKSISDISYLALYPWDLYVSTPEGTDIKKLLASVQGALSIKWSPKENIIAFSGVVDGVSGIWLIEPETVKLIRVWEVMGDNDFFDWSPDGRKIVVINSAVDKNLKVTAQKITVIDLKLE